MEINEAPPTLSVKEYLITAATDPKVQAEHAMLSGDELHPVLVAAGMTPEDAQLLVNARESAEGKQALIETLNVKWRHVVYASWRKVVQTSNQDEA